MPKADKCIKCFRLYSLESFSNIEGNTEWMFLKEFPFFFSNKIPIKFIQMSDFLNNSLILFSSNILASTMSI